MKIKFVTTNSAKVALAKERLAKYGISPVQESIELEENRSIDVENVALYKTKQALKKISEPFLIEDSAFYIECLSGFPGTFIKLAFDVLGEEKICKLVKDEENRKAYVKSVLVYGNPKTGKNKIFTGVFNGLVSDIPKGENSRGWKIVRLFIPKGSTKTLAEFDNSEWQKFLNDFQKNDHFEKFGKWISQTTTYAS
jgi:XTP/dITP diphosphohydrolase